jgi:hypothetical protein
MCRCDPSTNIVWSARSHVVTPVVTPYRDRCCQTQTQSEEKRS